MKWPLYLALLIPVAAFGQTVAVPLFFPPTGTQFANGQIISIQLRTSGSKACVTTDGSTPTATTPGTCSHGTTVVNNGTVTISGTETVNALGTLSGDTNSAVVSASYTVGGGVTSNIDDIPPTSSSSPAIGWATPPYLDTGCAAFPATSYPHTIGNASPSVDGFSSLFTINGPAETCVGWFYNAGPQDLNNQVVTNDFQYESGSTNSSGNANEFDVYLYEKAVNSGGCLAHDTDFYFGTQCVTSTGNLQIWDQSGTGWHNVSPALSCASAFAPGTGFHHVVMNDYWTCGDTSGTGGYPKQCYKSIVIDGVTKNINTCYSASALPGGYGENTGGNYELDIGSAGTSLSANIDELTITFAPTPSGTTYVSQGGGSVSCGTLGTLSTVSVATWNASTLSGAYGLCGIVTTPMIFHNGGTSGTPVTLQWESNASVQVCSTTGAVQLGSHAYITLDFAGLSNAITCPNNGTGLGSTVLAVAVNSTGNNVEFRNGTIGPLYQYACCGSDGVGSTSIQMGANSNSLIHGISFNNANIGIAYVLGGTTSGNQIYSNTFASTVGRGIDYSNGAGSGTDTGARIYDNDCTLGDGWYSAGGNYTHIECIRSFNQGSSATDALTDVEITSNRFHGSTRGDATTFVFIPNGGSCPSTSSSWSGSLSNNLFSLDPSSTTKPGDGFILTQDCHHTIGIYGNTLDCGSAGNSLLMIGIEAEGTNTVTMNDNIIENCKTGFYNTAAGITLSASNNDWFNIAQWFWQSSVTAQTTLGNWQSASGTDSASIITNPGLNSNYTITSTGSAAYQAGITPGGAPTAFFTGAPLTPGNPTSCGAGCIARPGSGAQDLGLYPFAGGSISYTLTVTPTVGGTISSSPSGIVSCTSSGGTCSASYASGTNVSLSQTPAGGYTFSGWGGACSGTGFCSVTMSAAESVTATYTSGSPTGLKIMLGVQLQGGVKLP